MTKRKMQLVLNQENVGVPQGVESIGVFTDSETGVEYFVFYGNGVDGAAMYPRYNANGSLMINMEYLDSKK